MLLISGDSSVAEDGRARSRSWTRSQSLRAMTKLSLRPMSVGIASRAGPRGRAGAGAQARPGASGAAVRSVDGRDRLAGTAAGSGSRSRAFATGALDRLAALLHEAQRPLVLAGPSAARWHAGAACRQLEEAQDLRVIPMESPRGLKDPSLGALAAVIPDADLIVLAGKCLDFTLGFGGAAALGGQARVVVIDPDAAMLERAQRLLGERLALAVQGEPSRRCPPAAARRRRHARGVAGAGG